MLKRKRYRGFALPNMLDPKAALNAQVPLSRDAPHQADGSARVDTNTVKGHGACERVGQTQVHRRAAPIADPRRCVTLGAWPPHTDERTDRFSTTADTD